MHAFRKVLRKVAAVALGVGVMAGSVVAWSAPASAAAACSGTRVEAQALKNVSGTTIGWLNVYRNAGQCSGLQAGGEGPRVRALLEVH